MSRLAPMTVALLVVLPACIGSGGEAETAAFRPTYAETECPSDVASGVVGDLSCGYLTVLEDRSQPGGRTVRLFVARVMPAGDVAPDPYFVAGTDIADLLIYGGLAPAAERTGRELIMMDARGVGHSQPSLACPEVDTLSLDVLAAPTDDPSVRASFLDAVEACYERVTADGIDPSMYSNGPVASDAIDLREALGFDEWIVASHGTASRISFEIARLDPEGVRGLFLDSPDVPEVDPFTEAIEGTRAALDAVSGACEEDPTCAAEMPDLSGSIDETLELLDASPITVDVPADAATDAPATVVVDDARFLSLLRQMLSDGGSSGGANTPSLIPATVAGVLRGELDSGPGSLIANVVDDQPYCTGFLPRCTPIHRYSHGALLSYLCRDIVPFVDTDALAAAAETPAARTAFAESPFIAACERWDVEPPDGAPAVTPIGTPALVELGRFDPYGNPALVGDALSEIADATIVEAPGLGHNISPAGCLVDLRSTWLEDPAAKLAGTACVEVLVPAFIFPKTSG